MSKAFTDEEALTASVPGRRVERAAAGQERPITAAGHQALLARAAALRTDVAQSSAEARGQAEHALALVEAALGSVRVAPPSLDDGVVRFGSVVELTWDDGRRQRVHLVGPDELDLPVDGVATRISVLSPLARALLEHVSGDEVELARPRGPAVATIERVSSSPSP